MERRLRLVVNNSSPPGQSFRSSSQSLHLVPDSEVAIRRIVKRFADFMLKDPTDDPAGYLHSRRRFGTLEVIGAIYCLSPKAADSMKADLAVIATLALHPEIKKAAMRKLCETNMPY
jgi:hypothetical protein